MCFVLVPLSRLAEVRISVESIGLRQARVHSDRRFVICDRPPRRIALVFPSRLGWESFAQRAERTNETLAAIPAARRRP